MKKIKSFIKKIVPLFLLNYITGLFYGWKGNFSSWDQAKKRCSGYDAANILEKVKESALKVKNGSAKYERDSVIFNSAQYSFPVLSGLMFIAAQNNGNLRVLDFGGSLGSTYYQNKPFLDSLPDVKWCIVEQPNFVKNGLEYFSDNRLQFYSSIEECLLSNEIDVILISSVLQYLEKPYELLDQIKSISVNFVLVDRTPFIKGPDRITIQKVHPKIYKAKYPCWFFNESIFLEYLKSVYSLLYEFDALDKANIPSKFKGFLFKKIKK